MERRGAYQRIGWRQRGVWLGLIAGLGMLAGALSTPGRAQPAPRPGPGNSLPFPTFPIHVAVAETGEGRAVEETWVTAQVEMANRIFEDTGLSFVLADTRTMPATHARLEDRGDRHALGDLMHEDVINWFAVKSLRDVDDPSRMRSGVHWRPAGHPGAHVVIVSARADRDVLAHELGHFFGNREHPDVPGNIMSYRETPPGTLPFFDDVQKRRIRRFAWRFLQSREILPVSGVSP